MRSGNNSQVVVIGVLDEGDLEKSVQLYIAVIIKIGEVYPGVKLVVVDRKYISPRTTVRVWITATPSQSDHIMQLIRVCNPNRQTKGWKFVKAFEDPEQRFYKGKN